MTSMCARAWEDARANRGGGRMPLEGLTATRGGDKSCLAWEVIYLLWIEWGTVAAPLAYIHSHRRLKNPLYSPGAPPLPPSFPDEAQFLLMCCGGAHMVPFTFQELGHPGGEAATRPGFSAFSDFIKTR